MSRVTPSGRIALPCGGTASQVIDLANEHGPAEPPAPESFRIAPGLFGVRNLPLLPMVRMHTDDMADDSRPIITDGALFWPEPGAEVFTGRLCDDCDARTHVLTDPGQTGLVAEHDRDCPAWRSLLARAGLAA